MERPEAGPNHHNPLSNMISWLRETREMIAGCDGLPAGWQLTLFLIVTLALFSRSPRLLTHAQFYAEDGRIWFAQAYNDGWLHSLSVPQAGYLNTMPRVASGLALLVPFSLAPLVLAMVGLVIQGLPVPILLSSRCRHWGSLRTRIILALFYVALPNAREIHIVVTNTQWHLAFAAVLVALSDAPQTWRGRMFDCSILLLAGLSGPYCILLAPLTLAFWLVRRQPWTLRLLALTGFTSITQAYFLASSDHRVHASLGATLAIFLRLLGGNVIACALFGSYSFANLAPMTFILPAALGGVLVGICCWHLSNIEWKLFLVYCVAIFAASLLSPLTEGLIPAWDSLLVDNSARYWFFPMLAFVWSAIWCVSSGRRIVRIVGICALAVMQVGIIRDWRYPAYADSCFAASVQRMHDARVGDRVSIPIAPEGWHMELVKRRL